MKRRGTGLLLVALGMVACGGTGGDAALPAMAGSQQPRGGASLAGEWTFMRFLGGPPHVGQITDTLRVDGGSRGVRVERNRASAGPDRTCEVTAPDGEAWRALVAAANDPDLQDALTHPERVPLLPLDVGYFACQHGRARIAVSDHRDGDAAAPRETAALRRLQTAYERFHREVVALPECGRL